MSFKPGSRSLSAFSLIELLVSMTIVTALMFMLCAFFGQATSVWQSSEKKVDAFREVRAALFYLKRDLEGLLVDSTLPFFYFEDPSSFAPVQYDGPDLNTPDANGAALFFFSSQPSDAQEGSQAKSDLCAIGYYLAYTKDPSVPEPAKKAYRLLRYFKSSDETWQSASYGLLPFFQTLHSGSPNEALLFSTVKGASPGDEVIARNVINFQARPFDSAHQLISGTGALRQKPAFFEISLTGLNAETAQKLVSQKDWHKSAPEYGNSVLFQQNAQEFTLRVALPR